MTDDLIARLRLLQRYHGDNDAGEAADALESKDRRIADLRKEADMMHSEYKAATARIAALEAALEERHRHHLELELRCRDLEAEKQAFKDGNKHND